jgi:hypothetical protein
MFTQPIDQHHDAAYMMYHIVLARVISNVFEKSALMSVPYVQDASKG